MKPEESSALTNKSDIKIVSSAKAQSEPVAPAQPIQLKVYKRRWFMIVLYMFFAGLISGQWVEYSIISNIIVRYYDVPLFAVHSTTIVFMLSYVIFILPMSYLSERIGLRSMIVLGSFLCCLGSWIKIFSVAPNRFLVTMFGQFLVATSMVISCPMPSQIAATWFGSDELSRATAFSVFGSQLGGAIMFLLPPMIVKNHDDVHEIGADLSYMFWILALASALSFVLILLFFKDEPKLPPSTTRALQKNTLDEEQESFMTVLKKLLTNKSFLILCNSYGLNVGIFNVLCTVLNSLYLLHFQNGEEDVGKIGLLIILTGLFGSVTFGVILDKTHKFKETAVIVYFLTFLGQVLFSVSVIAEIKWMVYICSIFLGFFMSGYLALGYELASEYTYPILEFQSTGVLNISNNVYGIVLVVIAGLVLEEFGDLYVHVILGATLLLGLILTILTKDEQRRQDARKAANYQGLPQEEMDLKKTSTAGV